MNQSTSFSCWLSVLSPVDTAQSKGRPVTGPTAMAARARTIASDTWPQMVSCGRWAEDSAPGLRVPGSSRRSTNSTRVGDCASMTWMSVRCTIVASASRRSSRSRLGSASSARTSIGQPGPSLKRTQPSPSPGSSERSSVVPSGADAMARVRSRASALPGSHSPEAHVVAATAAVRCRNCRRSMVRAPGAGRRPPRCLRSRTRGWTLGRTTNGVPARCGRSGRRRRVSWHALSRS
jgi:hypothetical protein